MERGLSYAEQRFSSPEEELKFLREKVLEKERSMNLGEQNPEVRREEAIREEINTYAKVPETVLSPDFKLEHAAAEGIVLDLAPESHDAQMSELLGVLQEHGIKNALEVVKKMGNPHIEDDFHRFLVEYIKKGFAMKGIEEGGTIAKALRHTLFEVTLPDMQAGAHGQNASDANKPLKELISSMEQAYAGLLSVSSAKDEDVFTMELAVANGSDHFINYVSVPTTKKDLFEKQILAIFPKAQIREVTDDYNIFNPDGVSIISTASLSRNLILPLKTYESFDYDPLNVVLNSFSKIKKDGEGASFQIVCQPRGDFYLNKFKHALTQLKKGVKPKKALDISYTFGQAFFKEAKDFGKGLLDFGSPSTSKAGAEKKEKEKDEPVDAKLVEEIERKVSSPIISVNIRIVASAASRARAEEILHDIEASFNQFEDTIGNKLEWKHVENPRDVAKALRSFSFRMWNEGDMTPLSIKELTSMLHFSSTISSAPQLKTAKAGTAPAPLDAPTSGLLLGINRDRGQERQIFITPEDRLRHFYIIGQTGTGKTTLLKNMIIQDIANGEGVCMIDPHGSDIQDVLANIPASRYDDVIYFDPASTARPMALNMLEYDVRYPEQKTFVVNEMLSIFNKLFDMKTAGGPMFEQYFRNAVMLVLEDPESGNTLVDVSRVLSNKEYRTLKLSRCKNPIVTQFWKEVAEKAGGEASLANIVPYITSKFDVFLSNDIMRPVVSQEKSSFNFREIMDKKKILLVNLSKGRLGDINSSLIGLIIVGKILMAALSRVDVLAQNPPPFYLYIDEFQNVTTDSISTILSEARKYKLSLTVAHQFIAQLEEGIKDSVFGNVGSIAAFRVGSEDAEFLEKQFAPVFTASDIMNLDNHHAYLRMLGNGVPMKPFSIEKAGFPPKGNPETALSLAELSYVKYGRDRAEVEAEIMKKYEKPKPVIPPPAPPTPIAAAAPIIPPADSPKL